MSNSQILNNSLSFLYKVFMITINGDKYSITERFTNEYSEEVVRISPADNTSIFTYVMTESALDNVMAKCPTPPKSRL